MTDGSIVWLPMKHICGCYLSWGCEVPQVPVTDADNWKLFACTQIEQFLRTSHAYPCPMHGSASGVPSAPLVYGEKRYIPQCNAWYMACPPDDYDKAEERAAAVMALGSIMYYPDGSMKPPPS
jgi:hypothetical protein